MTRAGAAVVRIGLAILLVSSLPLAASAVEPAHGDLALDFALPALRFYDFDLDRREITRQNAGLLYEPVRLSAFQGKRPVLLVFVSQAGSPGGAKLAALERLHRAYRDRVQFLLVYTREAPAPDPSHRAPATLLERTQLANSFVSDRGLEIPCLVDRMDDATMRAYAAESARVYLVGADGRIAFAGGRGLAAFDPAALEMQIRSELSRHATR